MVAALYSELRKGNLLHFETPVHVQLGGIILKEPFVKTVRVSTYGIHLIETDPATIVKPVDITLTRLLGLGFKVLSYSRKKDYDYTIGLPFGNYIRLCNYTPVDGYLVKMGYTRSEFNLGRIRYIHKLQNMFYELSGGWELEIKK
jgi:hypothetical protein